MNEPIIVTGTQVQAWDIDRFASALLDIVEALPTDQLTDLAAIGRRLREDAGGGDTAKGTAA